MAPARKSKRQAKPPAKLNEFVCEDNVEMFKDDEPRRSRRTPKISEKLKTFMGNKGTVKKELTESPPDEQTSKKATKQSPTTTKLAQGNKTGQPRVVLQPLPRSYIQATAATKGKFKQPPRSPEKKVPVLGRKPSEARKAGRMTASNVIARASPSTSNSKAGNMAVKRKLEMDKSARLRVPSVEAKRRKSKPTDRQAGDSFSSMGIGDREEELIPRVNRDILNKLIGFGAEIAEAMDSNREAIVSLSLSTNKPRRSILDSIKADKSRNLTDEDVNAILKWLDEEEEQRRAYRKRILDSLKASHEINMALYNQMLQVLQSVTLSV